MAVDSPFITHEIICFTLSAANMRDGYCIFDMISDKRISHTHASV